MASADEIEQMAETAYTRWRSCQWSPVASDCHQKGAAFTATLCAIMLERARDYGDARRDINRLCDLLNAARSE